MKKNCELDIRYTRVTDAPYLKKWLLDERVASFLSAESEEEFKNSVNLWMFFSRLQSSITATVNHVPVAIATLFLFPYNKVKHHSAFKICVDPSKWNEGIGSNLLKNIKHLAKNYCNLEAIHTEVYGADNPLIPFLKRFGFREFAYQKKYVKKRGSYLDRICLICELKEGAESETTT